MVNDRNINCSEIWMGKPSFVSSAPWRAAGKSENSAGTFSSLGEIVEL